MGIQIFCLLKGKMFSPPKNLKSSIANSMRSFEMYSLGYFRFRSPLSLCLAVNIYIYIYVCSQSTPLSLAHRKQYLLSVSLTDTHILTHSHVHKHTHTHIHHPLLHSYVEFTLAYLISASIFPRFLFIPKIGGGTKEIC